MARSRKWNRIQPIEGWVLITREETGDDGERNGDWRIAWPEPFGTRRSARQFAGLNNWRGPWQAVRGQLMTFERAR
jgi:hypothetical protein